MDYGFLILTEPDPLALLTLFSLTTSTIQYIILITMTYQVPVVETYFRF